MQTTRQRIDSTNQHRHNAIHFSQFELKMVKTSPETIVFREANYLSWRLLINENYDIDEVSHPYLGQEPITLVMYK